MDVRGLLFLLGLIVVLAALATAVFQWLWNITMPEVFALKEITFWQALRLLILTSFLLSGSVYTHFGS